MQTVIRETIEYRFEEAGKIHGVKRVLVFCTMIVMLPATLIILPMYLRRNIFGNVTYPVAESDIIEIRDGISSIFCEKHSLYMNSNFNAFQLLSKPEISTSQKHIRLKKSMTLPDDTLEYWGFYLLKGARVQLKFCSRYDGSRILVVKGQRILRTCGLLDHNQNKLDANFAQGHEQVKVFFEDITEIASNIPARSLDAKSKIERDYLMEVENHAAEDFNEDNIVPKISVHVANTNKSKNYRKKLKKGSLNSLRAQKVAEVQSRSSIYHNFDSSRASGEGKSTPFQHRPEKICFKEKHLKPRVNQHTFSEHTTNNMEPENLFRVKRHRKKQNPDLYENLFSKPHRRLKRNEHVYDRKYSHGGNAVNFTETDESNSVSSFESGLFDCYNGDILLAEGFPPSPECLNTQFLENGSHRMLSKHDITEDGYYYYIFYSDNDLVRNDIHAIFDIYKPTFQYSNLTEAQGCINATNCTFSIGFLSDEIVVVEVPTRDGIEHEDDDTTFLISTCHPRTEIYAIFPIGVLILILTCSFL